MISARDPRNNCFMIPKSQRFQRSPLRPAPPGKDKSCKETMPRRVDFTVHVRHERLCIAVLARVAASSRDRCALLVIKIVGKSGNANYHYQPLAPCRAAKILKTQTMALSSLGRSLVSCSRASFREWLRRSRCPRHDTRRLVRTSSTLPHCGGDGRFAGRSSFG